ncbi:MAG: DUF58 domain-containing protein [Anaerolineae bacterium]|jgi:uncharacterized protein (DUF58 family)|nr:DUF58 domain-containing protein [Anaerolineae bacterium]
MFSNPRRNIVYLLILGSLGAGYATGRELPFYAFFLLLGVLVASFLWANIAVRWVGLGRKTPTQTQQVGKSIEERFRIRNLALFPKLWLEVKDHSNLPGHRASHVVPALAPRAHFEWGAATTCISRGEFRLGPMTVSSGDLFGLFTPQHHIPQIGRLIVTPRVVPIKRFHLLTGNQSGGEVRRQRSSDVTPNVAGARDYSPGDSLSIVDWRASARYQRLMVKEYDIDPLDDVWVLADFSTHALTEDPSVRRINDIGPIISMHGPTPPSTEEYTAVIAASLATYFLDIDRAVGFTAYIPTRTAYPPDRSNRQITQIVEALGVARSTSPLTLDHILAQETPNFSRGTTLILVTATTDTTWLNRVRILQRRGVRTMCIHIDPATFVPVVSSDGVRQALRANGVPTITIRRDDDLTQALSQKPK